jgi:hypothetical protein
MSPNGASRAPLAGTTAERPTNTAAPILSYHAYSTKHLQNFSHTNQRTATGFLKSRHHNRG